MTLLRELTFLLGSQTVILTMPFWTFYFFFLFLIYITDLGDGLSSNTKLFADDTSLFSIIHDSVIMTSELNSDLTWIKVGFSVEYEL